jgi:predicted nucleotidyltransferase component of viral defense system
MKALRIRLQEARRDLGLPWEVIERDYLLSWILVGLGQVEALRESLVFKGGTALKKCYFGEYRFSEDLDFSGLAGCPTGEALEKAIEEACEAATALLDEYAPVDISCSRYTERNPHPGGQEAFTIRARLPWQRDPTTRVMIEITVDEPVLWPVARRRILHGYGEPIQAEVHVYALEEIVAEKLRAILQHARNLQERGWSRSRARDYYDLWRLFGAYGDRMELADFGILLRDKCAVRAVTFAGPEDFFQARTLAYVESTWEQWLGPLVTKLPPFETVVGELRPRIEALSLPTTPSATKEN